MPKTYKHLNSHERDLLAVLRSKGKSLREIAKILRRDPGTLSRDVEDRIRDGWSPELIAGRIRIRHSDLPISHEAIYQWVYTEARHLIRFLVRAHRKRQRRGYSRKHRKTHILREGLNPKTSSKRV